MAKSEKRERKRPSTKVTRTTSKQLPRRWSPRTCPCLIEAVADRGIKVCLLPCLGLEDAIGTAVRQACYRVAEDLRPNLSALGCIPALFVGAEEDVVYVLSYPVLAIEACNYGCATRMCQKYGKEPDAVIYARDVLRKAGIKLADESNYLLGKKGEQAVEVIAQKMVEELDRLVFEEVRRRAKAAANPGGEKST